MNILELIKNFFSNNVRTNMEKEIFEQPDTIRTLLKKYFNKNGTININLPENIKKIALIASGSSYHSATIAANYLRDNVHCYAQSYYASEFSLLENVDVDNETLYIFISQSGETSDTNKSLDLIKVKTDKTLAITNTKNSTLYNNAKYKILLYAGIEKSIASTKAMCAQLFCLFLIAVKIMQQREIPANSLIDELYKIPSLIERTYSTHDKIKEFSKKLSQYENAAVLASGMFYPLAKEGALKIKETSYKNISAAILGEFMHGHVAVLNNKSTLIFISVDKVSERSINNLNKIKEDYAPTLAIIGQGDERVKPDYHIFVDCENEIQQLFANVVILQLLALETALKLKRNVDHPKGLHKIVVDNSI